MVDKFYPTAPVEKVAEEEIDEAVEAAGIIAKMEAGEDNKCILISKQLAGRNCVHKMTAVYSKVLEEKQALRSVQVTECKTQTELETKLAEKAVYADPTKWLAGVKLANEVTTWTALKELYPTPVIVEKEVVEKL